VGFDDALSHTIGRIILDPKISRRYSENSKLSARSGFLAAECVTPEPLRPCSTRHLNRRALVVPQVRPAAGRGPPAVRLCASRTPRGMWWRPSSSRPPSRQRSSSGVSSGTELWRTGTELGWRPTRRSLLGSTTSSGRLRSLRHHLRQPQVRWNVPIHFATARSRNRCSPHAVYILARILPGGRLIGGVEA
jgi:hypothetical protein